MLATAILGQRAEVIIVAVVICGLIFELVRRKQLMEKYAILWLVFGVTVLVLGLWRGLLSTLAGAADIHYVPAALFAVAFLFVLALLIHFSMSISRLSEQNKTMAQNLALLQQEVQEGASVGSERREG